MNSRPLLLGFGLGLIFAAGFIFAYWPTEAPMPTPKLTDLSSVQRAAKELDLIVLTREDYETLVSKSRSAQSPSPSPNVPSSSAPPSTANGKSAPGTVKVTIPRGLTSEQVAELLLQKGVIKDKQAFLKAVWKRNVQRQIIDGTYQISVPISVEKLVEQITKLPDS
jgi:hypothetical protein